MSITAYYLFFAAINLALTYMVYRAWRDHIRTWKIQDSRWQVVLLLLAGLLILFATLLLAILHFATFEGWRTAMNPATPAPMTEIVWIIGIFAVAIPTSFAGMLQTFVRKEYDELIP